jgi:hypothetical protein
MKLLGSAADFAAHMGKEITRGKAKKHHHPVGDCTAMHHAEIQVINLVFAGHPVGEPQYTTSLHPVGVKTITSNKITCYLVHARVA